MRIEDRPNIALSHLDLQDGRHEDISDLPIVVVPLKNVCISGGSLALAPETRHWLIANVGHQYRGEQISCWDYILAESATGLATFRFKDVTHATLFKMFFS
jgi:hypothetical protein